MAVVGRPPVLRRRHHRLDVLLQGIEVELLELLGVVELLAHGVGATGGSGGGSSGSADSATSLGSTGPRSSAPTGHLLSSSMLSSPLVSIINRPSASRDGGSRSTAHLSRTAREGVVVVSLHAADVLDVHGAVHHRHGGLKATPQSDLRKPVSKDLMRTNPIVASIVLGSLFLCASVFSQDSSVSSPEGCGCFTKCRKPLEAPTRSRPSATLSSRCAPSRGTATRASPLARWSSERAGYVPPNFASIKWVPVLPTCFTSTANRAGKYCPALEPSSIFLEANWPSPRNTFRTSS